VPDTGSITHTRLTYRPNGEKENNMTQKILSADIINHHFDRLAETIERTAMSGAKVQLLEDNETERQKFLKELETFGEVRYNATGQQWTMVPQSQIYRIRKSSGMTRNDFAAKYHIPIRTLEKWERSEITPAEYLIEWLERLVKIDTEGAE
jgi:putative transcriptional regulator